MTDDEQTLDQLARRTAAYLARAHLQLGADVARASVDEIPRDAESVVGGLVTMQLLEAISTLVRGIVAYETQSDPRKLTTHQRELDVLGRLWDALELGDLDSP